MKIVLVFICLLYSSKGVSQNKAFKKLEYPFDVKKCVIESYFTGHLTHFSFGDLDEKIFKFLKINPQLAELNYIVKTDPNRGLSQGYIWNSAKAYDFNYHFTDKNGIVVKPNRRTFEIAPVTNKNSDIEVFFAVVGVISNNLCVSKSQR